MYRENNVLGIKQLTDDIKAGVEAVTINVNSDKHYDLAEDLLTILAGSDGTDDMPNEYKKEELTLNRKIVEKLNYFNLNNPEISKKLEEKIHELKHLMKQSDLEFGPLPNYITTASNHFTEQILFLILSPVMLYGFLNNAAPWFLMQKLSAGIKELQFKSSARLLAGLLLFPIFYLLQGSLVLFFTGSFIWSTLYVISVPITGVISWNLIERYKNFKKKWILHRLKKTGNSVLNRIYSLRDEILSEFWE